MTSLLLPTHPSTASLMFFHIPNSAPGSWLETSRKPHPLPTPHQSYSLTSTVHLPWHSLPPEFPFMPTLVQPLTLAASQLWTLYFPTIMLFLFCMPRPLGSSKIPPRPALPAVQGFPSSLSLERGGYLSLEQPDLDSLQPDW